MKLFSYVITYDSGGAPNPFWGWCTLATCKPVIRRVARAGDWVVGIGAAGKETVGKLVYAMHVDEVMGLEEYFLDKRFGKKKPIEGARDARRRVGDNVYFQVKGRWKKLKGGTHTMAHMEKDVRGKNVLVSQHFYYFGSDAVELPERLKRVGQGGQGHRSWFPATYVEMLAGWLERNFSRGVRAMPRDMETRGGKCRPKDVGKCVTKPVCPPRPGERAG